MTDYWLSKLFYDLQSPDAARRWREGRTEILDAYPLSPATAAMRCAAGSSPTPPWVAKGST